MKISELKARQTLKNLATGKIYKVRKSNGGKHLHLVCPTTKKAEYVLTYELGRVDYELKGYEYA